MDDLWSDLSAPTIAYAIHALIVLGSFFVM